MGSNQSSTTSVQNISNQLYVNKSTISQLSEQLNSVIANTIVKNAVNSGNAILNNQTITFKHLQASGDIDLSGTSQTQQAAITFSVMNTTQARNDAATNFIQTTLESLSNNTSTDLLTKMDSTADSKVKSGFLSTLPVSSSSSVSEVTNINNLSVVNENNKNIANILQNVVQNNFTTETVTSCVTNINNSQTMAYEDLVTTSGSIRALNLSQNQTATAISQCGSITNATNNIISQTLNALDLKVDETNSLKSETTSTAAAAASTESKGVFDSLNSWLIVIVVVIMIIMIIVVFMIFQKNIISSLSPFHFIKTLIWG
uniref:Uncharacterized protein n=1 Tax=viral metagenome TaxID=1070528 RepID=A0A6C0BJC5_9ZZZZ